MSPRRSSRARTTQPPPTAPQHTTSSNSSNSLPRTERSSRSHQKLQSPQTTSTKRSESLDNPEITLARGEPPPTRRSKRNEVEQDEPLKVNRDEAEYDEGDGEEVTRCICKNPEYPGPPASARDPLHRTPKVAIKDEQAQNSSIAGSEALGDESGNFFIQCDSCQVWQHGGCVGLMDEAMSPDEYFCEVCRPDLHRLQKGPNG